MPGAPEPITSPPDEDFQPYDAAAEDGSDGKWAKVTDSGPADPQTFMSHGDWPDGPAPWRQT